MAIKLSPQVKAIIQSGSFGLNGDVSGGAPRKTYYTPDGRIIHAIPSIREYVKKDAQGKVIATGTRDANLDKGWLLEPPKRKKKYCPGCDAWHDTQKQIDTCVLKSKRFIDMSAKKALQDQADENSDLKKRISDLEAMVNKLMEKK